MNKWLCVAKECFLQAGFKEPPRTLPRPQNDGRPPSPNDISSSHPASRARGSCATAPTPHSMAAFLRMRHTNVATRVAEAFDISEDISKAAVKASLDKWNDFFAGKGPSHILAYYQPRDKKSDVSSWVGGGRGGGVRWRLG